MHREVLMSGIARVALMSVVFVALSLLSLPAATSSRAAPLARSADGAVQLAETHIVCPRGGCRSLRAGCRPIRGAKPRYNRVVCERPARA